MYASVCSFPLSILVSDFQTQGAAKHPALCEVSACAPTPICAFENLPHVCIPITNALAFIIVQVAHFSKYGLQDSDEEEEEHPSKVDAKKLKTAQVPSQGQLVPQQMALNGKPTPPAQVEKKQWHEVIHKMKFEE